MKKLLATLLTTLTLTACSSTVGNYQTYNNLPYPQQNYQYPVNNGIQTYSRSRSSATFKIATFNIEAFGQKKMSKPEVMNILVDIISKFDIVAIQEIRSVEQNVIPTLVSRLGYDKWDAEVSMRLGRTSSSEQYAYVYRKDKIVKNYCYQTRDHEDWLHREPFICNFSAGKFDFSLVNIHTDPDEVNTEVNYLDNVFKNAQRREKDTILLGDLNAGPGEFGELRKNLKVNWIVTDAMPTNTRKNATYDNILFVKKYTTEFTFKGGVYDFPSVYKLSLDQALEVSDHLPVWGEFKITSRDDD